MTSNQIPEDGITHPLFIPPMPYLYQVSFRANRWMDQVITYTSPHEIILNLYCFKNEDRITYIHKSTNDRLFTITVDKFKYMIAQSLLGAVNSQLEILYMRLLLTNHYSKSIVDKGRFRQYDFTLSQFLLRIRGGYDSYLTMEKLQVMLYSKSRRLSGLHLLTVIQDWNFKNDIRLNHINLPATMPNRGLVYECLRIELSEKRFKLYSYSPIEDDNILPTEINAEIIQVINQLIK